ncbi:MULTISPECIES: DUF2157 domain-containing protein [Alphaproteobacteria]|uniref:DUF2157 domain-containing protein n=2 Tax=Alphaproteobacteria TaxID=28211 RepID=A0A512HHH0_9HYPH|nr:MULTISPECIES: DUF2157 domain-containing protein [Alphaproteobacteria]GEO84899.1 hypothetical protein RNA01_18310 [Ciceribacter naphthalenivorans]GLR22833.1 hypothetical protein GCM10007920_26210 [Ciceribacter naphthalenivorans]GLT05689.1 hypothetical protein GCM10007926_26210 [Sphingomonas psychrolutea]
MYRGKLKRDLNLWVDKGLIDQGVADALLSDVDSRRSSFSVGGVLMILAAVLVAASILLLIAANWEEIPRLAKVGGIVALIWIFHGSAALAFGRGADRFGGALLVLGSACFGGAIALIGQLYHLSGDAFDAMLLWFAMTVLSAAAFRSSALTVMAGFLAFAVFGAYLDEFDAEWHVLFGWWPLLASLVLGVLSRWTGAGRAGHFVYLLLIAWLGWIYALWPEVETAAAYAAGGMVLFLAATLPLSPVSDALRRQGAAPAFYAFVLALMGLCLLHLDWTEGRALAGLGLVTIAVSLLALALDGRDNGAVRYLAYTAFACEVLYLSFVTIDSMLGTSAFFLLAGLVVAVLAGVVVRLEKLFAKRVTEVRP